MGNVTLVSTDPQEVVDRVLQVEKTEEPTFGEVAEASAETEAESQTAQAESAEEAKHPSKRSQKIKKLADKLTQTEKERDEWRQKAESGRTAQPEVKAPDAYPVPKPKREESKTDEEWVEAVTDWKADEREFRKEQTAKVEYQKQLIESHFDRVDDARDKYDDFDDVVEDESVHFRDDNSLNAFKMAIVENEDGPDVLYYLGNHPDVAEEFSDLTPGQVAVKVGRIASSLNSPKTEKPAPRLINPVGGGSKQPDLPADRSNMSHAEWRKQRRAGAIR